MPRNTASASSASAHRSIFRLRSSNIVDVQSDEPRENTAAQPAFTRWCDRLVWARPCPTSYPYRIGVTCSSIVHAECERGRRSGPHINSFRPGARPAATLGPCRVRLYAVATRSISVAIRKITSIDDQKLQRTSDSWPRRSYCRHDRHRLILTSLPQTPN